MLRIRDNLRFACLLPLAAGVACDAPRPAVSKDVSAAPVRSTSATPTEPSPSSPPKPPSPPADYEAPNAEGWGKAGELRYLEVVKGGAAADAELPMVVLVHGLGDRPRDGWIDQVGVPMRVIMPQAPTPYEGGFAWFPYRAGVDDPAALAKGVSEAAAQLALAVKVLAQQRPTDGRPVVGGFSQGGMLSYAMAVLHPELIEVALPVSGTLPRALWPEGNANGARRPPIRALHGDADIIVAIDPARSLVTHLAAVGYDAGFTEYPGVGHEISPQMGERFGAAIDQAAKAIAKGEGDVVSPVETIAASETAAIDQFCSGLGAVAKDKSRRQLFGVWQPDPKLAGEWRRFKTDAKLDKAVQDQTVFDMATAWRRDDGALAVLLQLGSPSGDWAHFVEHCFRADGTLARLESTLNTFYANDNGEGVSRVRTRRFTSTGQQADVSNEVRNLSTKKPAPGAEFTDQDEPIYKTRTALPFARLLR